MHPETQIRAQLEHATHPARSAQRVLAVLTSAALVLLWYWPTSMAMVKVWRNSDTFAHCFVVLPLFAYLVWRERRALAQCPLHPFPPAVAALAVAGAVWTLGKLASVAAMQQLAMVSMIPLALWAVLGTEALRVLAFPLTLLFFVVPVGEFLVPKLMDWTADFTVSALRLSGVPVYREDNHFHIPSGSWSVVEGCSGIRYLVASVMGGMLFAHFFYRSWRKRALFIVASVVTPVVANWVRAYLIVMLGHLSNNRIAAGVDHLVYGWLFFGVIIMAMFAVGARYADAGSPPAGKPRASSRPSRQHLAPVLVAAVALVGIWPPAYAVLFAAHAVAVALPQPAERGGWRLEHDRPLAWRPHYLNAAAEQALSFARGSERVGVFLGYYRDQERRGELVHWANGLLAPAERHRRSLSGGLVDAPLGVAATPVQATHVIDRRAGNLTAWHWYWIDGHITANPFAAKAYLARARLAGRGDDSAVVVVYTGRGALRDTSARTLAGFLSDMWPSIEQALRQAEGGNP
jgi:exosortase A